MMRNTLHRSFTATLLIAALCVILIMATACDKTTPSDNQQDTLPAATQTHAPESTNQPESSGFSAPDFTVLDKDGNTVKLSDFHGKPIILNFWATWCPPCKAEMPDLQEAYEAYGDEVCFVMVNLTDGSRDTVESVKDFVTSNGYTFPVYFDTTYSASNAYGVSSIPTTYFISAEGEIIGSKVGMMTAEEIEAGMKLLTE